VEQQLKQALKAGFAAADPAEAVRRYLRVEDGEVVAGDARFGAERVFVLAAGKAAGAMAEAAEEVLGDLLAGGLIVIKEGHPASSEVLKVAFASHPEPDEKGVEAARRTQELAESLGEGDLLLALISGGASALLADPAPPIGLEDLKRLTGDLLRSGDRRDQRRKEAHLHSQGRRSRPPRRPRHDPRPPALGRRRRRVLRDSQRPYCPGPDYPPRGTKDA
jgi:glycerate 2-kinase